MKKRLNRNFIGQLGAYALLVCLFVVLPAWTDGSYNAIGEKKWELFAAAMPFFLIVFALTVNLTNLKKWSLTDFFVLAYLVLNCITYFTCKYPYAALYGMGGWKMGFVTQLYLIGIYFLFSFGNLKTKYAIYCMSLGMVIPGLVAILQRVGINPFYLLSTITKEEAKDYLSTVGNRTWLAAFELVVLPLVYWLYVEATVLWERAVTGVCSVLFTAALFVTYSNAGLLGFVFLLYYLGVICLHKQERLKRYFEILMLICAAGLCMCGLWKILGYNHVEAFGLSALLFSPAILVSLLVLLVGARILVGRVYYKIPGSVTGYLIWLPIIVAILISFLISVNTYFGLWDSSFLFFDNSWGDSRGFNWKAGAQTLREMSLKEQFFGLGQDAFAWNVYSDFPVGGAIRDYWGERVLANVHNEWFNMILTNGILGGAAYLGIFISAIMTGVKKHFDGHNPLVLCLVGYMVCNFFCYQQIVATAPVFVVLGLFSSGAKNLDN